MKRIAAISLALVAISLSAASAQTPEPAVTTSPPPAWPGGGPRSIDTLPGSTPELDPGPPPTWAVGRPARVFSVPPASPLDCTTPPGDVAALAALAPATERPGTPTPFTTDADRLAANLAAELASTPVPATNRDQLVSNPPSPGPFGRLPPASATDRAEIVAFEHLYAACESTNDLRNVIGLYTSEYLHRYAATSSKQNIYLDLQPGEAADPFDPIFWSVREVGPVVDLGDGRLAALVDTCGHRMARVYERDAGEWRVAGEADAPFRVNEADTCRIPDLPR